VSGFCSSAAISGARDFRDTLILFLDEPTGSVSTTIESVRWVDHAVHFSREKPSFALSLVLLVKAAKT
jgi:hypothetical protein